MSKTLIRKTPSKPQPKKKIRPMRYVVFTERDTKGNYLNNLDCPLCRAIKHRLRKGFYVHVTGIEWEIIADENRKMAFPPKVAASEINDTLGSDLANCCEVAGRRYRLGGEIPARFLKA